MKIVLTELEMKEAIADYMAKQASSVEIIKMDAMAAPASLGLELGKNTKEAPFKPEVKYAPPAPVKRTRGPNKKTLTPVVEPILEPVAESNTVESAPTVVKESDPFVLDETPPVQEDPGTGELELDSPAEEISDEVNLFA